MEHHGEIVHEETQKQETGPLVRHLVCFQPTANFMGKKKKKMQTILGGDIADTEQTNTICHLQWGPSLPEVINHVNTQSRDSSLSLSEVVEQTSVPSPDPPGT